MSAQDGNDNDEQFLSFTPEKDSYFDIDKAAIIFARLIEETQMPLILNIPEGEIEFEVGITAQEIIDGYNEVMEQLTAELEEQARIDKFNESASMHFNGSIPEAPDMISYEDFDQDEDAHKAEEGVERVLLLDAMETGFDIAYAAPKCEEAMKKTGLPLSIVYAPDHSINFDPVCTSAQIIAGYNDAIEQLKNEKATPYKQKKPSRGGPLMN